ncbi:constitutive coactivator of peroxisome proliferator-activated receptor gamma [Pelodytes ibericus]
MGIKGLMGFVQSLCPDVCSMVNLQTLASRHKSYSGCTPIIVVDAMSCLRFWYTPHDWIHGGQWKEYLCGLQSFIKAFQTAGIRLVFIFDGVVEQKKRQEWVKRRLRNNYEISQIFNYIRATRQQPGRNMFFIPSGIATFTRFALKTLGQEVICSRVEADYEVAVYGLQHNCLGILGEDSDYLIFNTVPFFSINKLKLCRLETVVYSRERLCEALNIHLLDLPLLACLLGNDTVPEHMVASFQRKCIALNAPNNSRCNRRVQVIRSVASFIASIHHFPNRFYQVERMLPHWFDRTLLHKGVQAYILPEQTSPWLSVPSVQYVPDTREAELSLYPDKEILQIILDHHYKGDNTMICSVVCYGETECSNTLEDESDAEIPGQALVYKLARQHIYAILLGIGNGSREMCPVVKEWYVYPGNQLQQPDLIQAVPLAISDATPSIRILLLDGGPDIERLRFYTCMACFHVENCTEVLSTLKPSLAAACCLLIYLAIQVESLTLEDVEAFLSQALCISGKSAEQLSHLQVQVVDTRAVHLSFLYLRGLVTLMGANSACGYPFNMMDLMPWNTFDGKLFHQKYLQCHRGCSTEELMEGNTHYTPTLFNLSLDCNNLTCSSSRYSLHSPRTNLPNSMQLPFTSRNAIFSESGRRTVAQYAVEFCTSANEIKRNPSALKAAFHKGLNDTIKDALTYRVLREGLEEFIALCLNLDARCQEHKLSSEMTTKWSRKPSLILELDLLLSYVAIYLDDILIYSKMLSDHRVHEKTILQCLHDNSLFAKAEKCEFEQNKVKFLGYVISEGHLEMDLEKVAALPSSKTLSIVFLKEIVCLHGVPQFIISDRGSQFISRFWKCLCNHLGITLHLSSAYHPRSNGQTERTNQVLKQYLRQLMVFTLLFGTLIFVPPIFLKLALKPELCT